MRLRRLPLAPRDRDAVEPVAKQQDLSPRHNGGPPLEDYEGPPWGKGDPHVFLHWKRAHREAWKSVSADVMRFRMEKADRLGLTYEEYTLEILERGRYLQVEDVERIAEIKALRRRRRPRSA
ncbi:hypothetical protein [Phreatobacter cathodiphilus]|uniref:Uncharacterized protein n=1 Tax=Phreatobacter cathodiphilus TaxID=1868589 RepID=A0A2S0NHU5_9HYPH|nr:hypothetical protein [Phreatobacter cathodiphilus]AVO47501.1 hypothetical protein C6569_02920 [Phreatobacter cathodiphilus]